MTLALITRYPYKTITRKIETKVSNRKIINRNAESLGFMIPAKYFCKYQAMAAATPVSKSQRIRCLSISLRSSLLSG